ncbi:MAG: class I SAM-dependent methyltransferase [Chloroflexi bacterium]|nr:class I SAM-dependent methyltransferase [Chloroflexota bacterium]
MSRLSQFLADEAASRFHLSLSPIQIEQFEAYLALLLAWNERLNLTAVRDPQAIVIRHFLDSLSCAVTGGFKRPFLIDVGSGAGFPGLPPQNPLPELRLTLTDSMAKKPRSWKR